MIFDRDLHFIILQESLSYKLALCVAVIAQLIFASITALNRCQTKTNHIFQLRTNIREDKHYEIS